MTFKRWAPAMLAAGLFQFAPAFAADTQFTADLDPAPMTLATRPDLTGEGTLNGTLNGGTLTIGGKFSGLASAATKAQLQLGTAPFLQGPVIATLTISQGTSGTISGTAKLSRAQIDALQKGGLYVEIDTVKVPDGTLRGWFLAPSAQ